MALFSLENDVDFKKATDTDYYKWLLVLQPDDIHAVKTKTAYLASLGFQVGVDKVESLTLKSLKYIEDEYFRKVIRGL